VREEVQEKKGYEKTWSHLSWLGGKEEMNEQDIDTLSSLLQEGNMTMQDSELGMDWPRPLTGQERIVIGEFLKCMMRSSKVEWNAH
jgi:hypothetical protein